MSNEHSIRPLGKPEVIAQDNTKPITNSFNGQSGYTGDFPCAHYNCPGCPHQLVADQNITGFPFELEEQIGQIIIFNIYYFFK